MSESMHEDTPHLSDDVCVDLILEQLPVADAREAILHLKECSDCETRFQELARQWELTAVRVPQMLPQAPDATRSASAPKSAWEVLADRFLRKRWLVPAAAAAVVLALVIIPRLGEEPRLPSLVKLPALSDAVQPRAVLPPEMNEALHQGIEAYNQDDFTGAIEALGRVDTDGALDAFRRIYLASALAWSGRYADVAAVLDDVPFELVPEPWSSEAQWTLYVALSATGETARAEALLHDLQATTGPVGDRARAIQQE